MERHSVGLRAIRARQAVTQVANSAGYVHKALLLVAYLSLDAKSPSITYFLQRLHEFLDVDLPLAKRHFFSPGAGTVGRFASLTWTLRMSGPKISTARSGSPLS